MNYLHFVNKNKKNRILPLFSEKRIIYFLLVTRHQSQLFCVIARPSSFTVNSVRWNESDFTHAYINSTDWQGRKEELIDVFRNRTKRETKGALSREHSPLNIRTGERGPALRFVPSPSSPDERKIKIQGSRKQRCPEGSVVSSTGLLSWPCISPVAACWTISGSVKRLLP